LKTQTVEFSPSEAVLLLTLPSSNPSLSSILNSHLDSVPAETSKWVQPPFAAHKTLNGEIFARGAQDEKCMGMQYLEALRNLRSKGFVPVRRILVSYVPDGDISRFDGAAKFTASKEFENLNVGFVLDEGQASPDDVLRVFYADPWNLIIRTSGTPGHGSKMLDNSAMKNLMKSVEVITKFRESHFDVVKAGNAMIGEVISVNPVFLKAGIPSPTMREGNADADWLAKWGSTQAITTGGGKLSKPEILASTTDARYVSALMEYSLTAVPEGYRLFEWNQGVQINNQHF
ncbi:Peptidase M20, partial [Dillenia turbinata]